MVLAGAVDSRDQRAGVQQQCHAGPLRVQVAAEPEDYPGHVSIWITSAD